MNWLKKIIVRKDKSPLPPFRTPEEKKRIRKWVFNIIDHPELCPEVMELINSKGDVEWGSPEHIKKREHLEVLYQKYKDMK